MDKIQDWLDSCLKHLSNHELFKNVVKINCVEANRLGEDMVVFVSEIYRCNVKLECENGESRQVNLIVKIEPEGPTYTSLIKQFGFFETEIMMYEKTLKEMEKLMSENGDEEDKLWPQCFYCSDNKLLEENLCDLGYRVVPTHRYLDLVHISLVMSALGKFHGMSMTLLEQKRIDPQSFKQSLLNKKIPFIINIYKGGITKLAEVIRDHWNEPKWSSLPGRLLKSIENVGDKLASMYEESLEICHTLVLNHGDLSIKNLLFLYGPDSERPTNVKFIDFQGCHLSTPARDLGMILFTSVMPQLREENIQELLKIYHESMTRTCQTFGYVKQTPTLEEIISGVNSVSYWTAIVSLCSLPVFLSSNKEDYTTEIEKFIQPEDSDLKKPKGAVSKAYYRIKIIEDALKYELERCINRNII